MTMHTKVISMRTRNGGSVGLFAVGIVTMMLMCVSPLGAQWSDSTRLKVFVIPTFDKQSWAVTHALNDLLISKSKTATVDSAQARWAWAMGGSIGAIAGPVAPVQAKNGVVVEVHDRRAMAQVFHADVLIAFVPDSVRPDSAFKVLLSATPMSVEGRNLGTWVVTTPEKTAALIYEVIKADTAFTRLKKLRN